MHSFPSHLLLVDPEHSNEMEAGLEANTEDLFESAVTSVLLAPCPCSLVVRICCAGLVVTVPSMMVRRLRNITVLRGVILDTEVG